MRRGQQGIEQSFVTRFHSYILLVRYDFCFHVTEKEVIFVSEHVQ